MIDIDEYIEIQLNIYKGFLIKYNVSNWGSMKFSVLRNFLNMNTDISDKYIFRKTINLMIKRKVIKKYRVNKRFYYIINLNKKSKKQSIVLEW
jgi:hypothetical protein|tara:strand:+ start:93 stop:371 length:279 start_codon:yes stop_codon:yes gene_type:complete